MLDNTSSVRSDSSRLDMLAAAVTKSSQIIRKQGRRSQKFKRIDKCECDVFATKFETCYVRCVLLLTSRWIVEKRDIFTLLALVAPVFLEPATSSG